MTEKEMLARIDKAKKDAEDLWVVNGLEKARLADELEQAKYALELWWSFWDKMPKGQIGKIVCDIGILNKAFCATRKVIGKMTDKEAARLRVQYLSTELDKALAEADMCGACRFDLGGYKVDGLRYCRNCGWRGC